MIELAQHIEALLLESDCVIVPSFGGFVAHYTPATRIKEENLFLPPIRSIGFNSQLKLNDGALVQSFMFVHDTNFSDATRMVEKEVALLTELLHEEGKAELENIGEIHYNIYGSYEFTPYDHKVTTPSLYGLDSFEMQELSSLQRKEKVLVPAVLTEKKKTYEISINRSLLRNAVAMIAAVMLFFTYSTPVENTDIQKSNYAQLLPGDLFEQIAQRSVATTPVPARKLVAVGKQPQQTAETPQTKSIAANKAITSKPIAVREIKVKQQESSPAETIAKSHSDNPFHIIVIGGIGMKDAEKIANQLKEKGFSEATILNNDGKVRVSLCSFDNREEATKQMLELRKNENYKNAWLLAK